MTDKRNRRILLASRPHGEPTPENFKLVETEVEQPEKGEMLLKTIYLSLDPYMRGRMNAGPSYAPPVEERTSARRSSESIQTRRSADAPRKVKHSKHR